jgi:hypothetical protein
MGRLQNDPSIGWVHPKSTHAHPLAWGNKKTKTPFTLHRVPITQRMAKVNYHVINTWHLLNVTKLAPNIVETNKAAHMETCTQIAPLARVNVLLH